jgi:hypothetical protein
MNRISFLVLLCSVLGLASCATTPPVTGIKYAESQNTVTQRQLLIGTWQGEAAVHGGGTRTWIVQRNADGTYKVDFTHTGVRDAPSAQSEMGIWGVSGGIYFTATRVIGDLRDLAGVDTDDPSLYDTYKIIRVNNETFEYQSLSTGDRYLVKRVDAPAGVP